MYDPSIGRWNGIDQLSEKNSSSSPYSYVANSPMIYTDPDGRDSLIMHIAFNQEKSTEKTAVFDVTFSLVSNGLETVIEQDEAMNMISDREDDDEKGAHLNNKDFFKLTFQQMGGHNEEPGWENTIHVYKSVFIHPAADHGDLGGCKGVTCNLNEEPTSNNSEVPNADFDESKSALQTIRDLYDSQENLTGDKFLLKPNSDATNSAYDSMKNANMKFGPNVKVPKQRKRKQFKSYKP